MPTDSKATQPPTPQSPPLREEVVYYSFAVPALVAQLFYSDRRADSRLAEVEEACKCSILVNAKRHPHDQQPQARGRLAPGEVTVEVLMDEIGGSFAVSVSRLGDLVRSLGGQLRIRRVIKKLSLGNGSQQYRVEQPQPQIQQQLQQHTEQQQQRNQHQQQMPRPKKLSKNKQSSSGGSADIPSPDSGRQGDQTTTPIGSVVLSFADETDGHWSLFSMVSPFMELDRPPEATTLTRNLWMHAVRQLAVCTRSMVLEAAAGELIVFSSLSKSVQDASNGEAATSDGDFFNAEAGSLDRNWSNEPESELTLFVTALICDKVTEDDTIDNFVCDSSNSTNMQVRFTKERDTERLTPNFSEPLLMLKSTECQSEIQRAATRGHAQPAISACLVDGAGHVLVTDHHRTVGGGQLMSVSACTCQPHGVSLMNGSLGQALKCPGQLRRPTQLGLATGNASQLACMKNSDAMLSVSDGMRLCSVELTCHATDHATHLWAPRRDAGTANATPQLQLPCRADGLAGGRATLTAASAAYNETPAWAQRVAQSNWRGASGGQTSRVVRLPAPEHHPAPGARLPLEFGACEQCHAGAVAQEQAQATDSRRADCRDRTPVLCAYRKGSCAVGRAVGLPRLLTAEEEMVANVHRVTDGCTSGGVPCSYALASAAKYVNALVDASALQSSCERHRCSADPPIGTVIRPMSGNAPVVGLTCPLSSTGSHVSSCAHQQVVAGSLQPNNAGVHSELCPLVAQSSADSVARYDCQLTTASLASTLTAPTVRQYPDSLTSSSGSSDGIRCGSHQRMITEAHDASCREFGPIPARNCLLSGFESTRGVRGVSCEIQQTQEMSAFGRSAAHCTLRLSPLTELSECAAAGSIRRRRQFETQLERAAALPRSRHNPGGECVSADCGCGGQLDATVPPELVGVLPLIEMHSHSRQGGTVTDCGLLSLSRLKASASRQLSVEVRETSISLQAPHCSQACRVLVEGRTTRCNHGQEALCQISRFERNSGVPLLPADSWQQLASLVAVTVAALEWAVAWPAMRQDTAASAWADAASTEALVSRYRYPTGTVVASSGDLSLHSELVWESRRRVQLTQSMLN